MRLYTETSMIYEGMADSLFLIEGAADARFNDYIKANKQNIAGKLRRKGVSIVNFNVVSPALLDDSEIKELILRQQPELGIEALEQKAVDVRTACGKSRLLFIGDVSCNEYGCYEARVFCEDNLGSSYEELAFRLDTFVNVVAEYYDERERHILLLGERYRFPQDDKDSLREHDNYECLCKDILADSVCDSENVKISPILFDDDFNISLPLYPNVTITLEPLPKTLYILFLQHPEGIVLKDIQMYETELKRIYSHVSGRKNPTVINRMFRSLIDPTENPLHKNLSIIRRSFTSKLNYNIARNYIPAHGRTKAHNIPLESEYVVLPEIL